MGDRVSGGGGGSRAAGVAPKGPKSILYKHSHVVYQSKITKIEE